MKGGVFMNRNKTEVVKMCDMPVCVALYAFSVLNQGKIETVMNVANGAIITDLEPSALVYPEG